MKKIIFILIFSFILTCLPLNNTYAFNFGTNIINDIDEHWSEDNIETLNNLGVMNGFNGYSHPNDIITRGEFTALIVRAFGFVSGENSKQFSDISEKHMFYNEICAASNSGIIDGFSDNTFRPDNMITREEIMLILSRIDKGETSYTAKFSDLKDDYIYMSQLSKIVEDEIISGYPDGTFKPYNKTTRAEAAKMVVKAMNKYIPSPSANTIRSFAKDYIVWHYSDIESASINSTGGASKDIEYIKNTYDVASTYGYIVTNTPLNITIASHSQIGPFSEFLINYDTKTSINENTKEYKGQSKLYTITQNGVTKAYRHDTRIIEPDFINLTWEVFSSPPSYNPKGINIVSPTCFRIEKTPQNKSRKINFDGNTLYFNSSLTDEYLNYAKSNGYKIWAMYKTDFEPKTASLFLNNHKARQLAGNILIEEIVKNRLDGINFDFENMYQKDKSAYTNHVREISIIAHTLGTSVSVDVTKYEKTSSTWSMCYDRNALSRYADYIMLMAYDQYYSGSKVPGPVAGLDWTEASISLTLNEVPKDKLVLGMPFYIRVWETKNGKTVTSKAVSMSSAIELIRKNNPKAEYDVQHRLNKYTWNENGKSFVMWMEDAQSTAQRVKLAKKYTLAGVASWRRGFETPDVWDTIYSEIIK